MEPVSDFFTKMPQKCYEARKYATVPVTHNSIEQVLKQIFCGEDPHSYLNECTFPGADPGVSRVVRDTVRFFWLWIVI